MLRWSAEETGRTVDLRAVADSTHPSGLPGGDELAALARGAAGAELDPKPLRALSAVIGPAAAVDAAAVAAAFESFNRVVDGTGLPVGKAARRDQADIIDMLGLDTLPHAGHGAG